MHPAPPKTKIKRVIRTGIKPEKASSGYFGMKIHVGADVNSGAVHTMTTTAANVADITELPKLLRKKDRVILADAGYTSDEYLRGARHLGIRWCVNDKRKAGKNLSASQNKRNRKQSSVRARVELVFRMIKQQFGLQKSAIGGWRKIHHGLTCWWVWLTCICSGGS
jgi:IS5 family transposase